MLSNLVEKARQFILKSLIFLRVVDAHDLNLSISNIAMIIALYKLFAAPVTSLTDIGALLVGLMNYSYKRFLNQDVAQASVITNKIMKKAEDIAT